MEIASLPSADRKIFVLVYIKVKEKNCYAKGRKEDAENRKERKKNLLRPKGDQSFALKKNRGSQNPFLIYELEVVL